VSVLSVCDVQHCCAALNLTDKKEKVHLIGYNKKEGLINTADEQIELFKLLINKCRSSEFNRVN